MKHHQPFINNTDLYNTAEAKIFRGKNTTLRGYYAIKICNFVVKSEISRYFAVEIAKKSWFCRVKCYILYSLILSSFSLFYTRRP
jgi:hypothetical protein